MSAENTGADELAAYLDWWNSLTSEDRYDFDSEGRGYKKDRGTMMFLAWQARAAQAPAPAAAVDRQAMAQECKRLAEAVRKMSRYVNPQKLESELHAAIDALASQPAATVPQEWVKSAERLPEPGALIVKRWPNKGSVWAGIYSGTDKDSSFDEWCALPHSGENGGAG